MENKHIAVAIDVLGATIADLRLSLWMKDREIEDLKKELAELKEGKANGKD
jgi:hypothetical protein